MPIERKSGALIIFSTLLLALILSPTFSSANATNEGSYEYGWQQGSLKRPNIAKSANWYPELDNNTCSLGGAVTNTTACEDGWFNGWKNWCTNHAIDCVTNVTLGYFPDMMIKAHEQYNMGYKAANASGNLCPIGENAAFCTGWYNNNGEDQECGESSDNGTFANHSLIGCPLDTMNSNQMAKPHALIGTWNYVNESKAQGISISGRIVYSDYGNFTLIIPTRNAFGDYKMEGSFGSMKPDILTQCYPYGACQNNTLTAITPNHIEFIDNFGNTIHLMR
jgi:hypothetical protein